MSAIEGISRLPIRDRREIPLWILTRNLGQVVMEWIAPLIEAMSGRCVTLHWVPAEQRLGSK